MIFLLLLLPIFVHGFPYGNDILMPAEWRAIKVGRE